MLLVAVFALGAGWFVSSAPREFEVVVGAVGVAASETNQVRFLATSLGGYHARKT